MFEFMSKIVLDSLNDWKLGNFDQILGLSARFSDKSWAKYLNFSIFGTEVPVLVPWGTSSFVLLDTLTPGVLRPDPRSI